jgi:hypothetical protein
MQPLTACIIGMMVGTVVLLGSIVYRPHPLSLFEANSENVCFCKK